MTPANTNEGVASPAATGGGDPEPSTGPSPNLDAEQGAGVVSAVACAEKADGEDAREDGSSGGEDDVQENQEEADGENNAAWDDAPVDTLGPAGVCLGPGAFYIHGPGYQEDREQNNAPPANPEPDGEMVFEGFLAPVPEPTPQELLDRQLEEMVRNAITLDDSAVVAIPDTNANANDNAKEHGDLQAPEDADNESGHGGKKPILKSPLSFVTLTVALLTTLALAVGLGGRGGDGNEVKDNVPPLAPAGEDAWEDCIEDAEKRHEVATFIVSNITSEGTLRNSSSPQARALMWIACKDKISSRLIDGRDPSTGVLSKQADGTLGGGSGEAQVLRRYIAATSYYALQEDGPWGDPWNFLSPDEHECLWHKNYTRLNFPFDDIDPAGLSCGHPGPPTPANSSISLMFWNFRISNNVTGTLPPEFGYLDDVVWIGLENQEGLRGSIPSTIGNMVNLRSLSVLFSGPDFGGVIPASLFTIPAMMYLTISFNQGTWEFPPVLEYDHLSPLLEGIQFKSTGLTGTLPSFISKLPRLNHMVLNDNSLEGSIPESLGELASLEFLDLADNKLSGTLPRSLSQLVNLTAMSLGKNDIWGTLPDWLGDLGKLRLLDLGHNKFEGPIPSTLSRLLNLELFSLQDNLNLNGSILAFESLQNLSLLLIQSNSFSSSIPAGLFSNVTTGRQIFADLGHNNFTGDLPKTFSRVASNTSYLGIMGNKFNANSVDDVICEQVGTIVADCSSCTCCRFCCDEVSADENDPFCNFYHDFYAMAGLDCGTWWPFCADSVYDALPLD